MKKYIKLLIITLTGIFLWTCSPQKEKIEITNQDLKIEIDDNLNFKVFHKNIEIAQSDKNASTLFCRDKELGTFQLIEQTGKEITDSIGVGKELKLLAKSDQIQKQLIIHTYDAFPNMVVLDVSYLNMGENVYVQAWKENSFSVQYEEDTLCWSFQGSSTDARSDWVRPVSKGYYDKNYMGMNSSDYGGGIPVCDVWRRDAGIAIGHLEMFPLRVSFPVSSGHTEDAVHIAIQQEYEEEILLQKGDEMQLPSIFIATHSGDCFSPLAEYSKLMQKRGIHFPEREKAAFEPVWCAWGYERKFTLDEIVGTLPKVKELGFKWAVLDDGYQIAEGDWRVNKDKFPQGEKQMKNLVKKIHSYGLKAKLWYAPLAADPCSQILKDDKNVLLYNEDWSYRFITWWDAWYMAPTYSGTQDRTTKDIRMFLDEWGFDGLKLDGQQMNAVPPDYNPEHQLDNPEEAPQKLAKYFQMIYDTARSMKPEAVVEHCPCGCCMSYFNMPTTNQFVSSDPLSSWQIRLKGKVYHALAPMTAYYGDHVELSSGGLDFASTVGIGGVPGTKFTYPKDNPFAEASYLLTPEKEKLIKKWISIYNTQELPFGEYAGDLYDIGFDKPEAHLIRKDNALFYAFYAKHWDGKIELRGLKNGKKYRVLNYENNRDLGIVNSSEPYLSLKFEGHLLIKLIED